MLLSIIIFTNSTAIEPGSSAIIIMLSLLLIILIVSINYKQEWGSAGRSREAGAPLGGGGGETGFPPTHLLLHPFHFWPKPSAPSRAWPRDTGGSRWAFPARVPGPSWPPHTEPHSASQKLLRHNYYRDSYSKLIFQLLHSCNHGDGPSSITCLSLFLKDSRGQDWRRRQRAEMTETEAQGERDTKSNGCRDPPRDRERQIPETERKDLR